MRGLCNCKACTEARKNRNDNMDGLVFAKIVENQMRDFPKLGIKIHADDLPAFLTGKFNIPESEESSFDKSIKDQLKRCEDTLLAKQKEYATEDKFHNFRSAAKLEHTTMERSLAGMMAKHTVSIYDMIFDDSKGFTIDQWNEKITDNMVYLLLLKAMLDEKFKQPEKSPQLIDEKEPKNDDPYQEIWDMLDKMYESFGGK